MTQRTDEGEARTEILRRISAALTDPIAVRHRERDYELTLGPGVDVVALFAERVADYRAVVRRISRGAVAAQIGAALTRRGVRRLVVPAGLDPEWLSGTGVVQLLDEPTLSKTELDAADGVLTACAVAIAETGTIVLDGGAGQGRRALSLLPDYHLCVVLTADIVGTVPQGLERLDPLRPQTWISGPSATSDIELERVEGVHGPRNLEVLIVG